MRKSILSMMAIAFMGITCMSCKEKEEEISSLTCSDETVMLQGGETASLTVEALPKGAKNLDYYWEIANTDIVSIDGDVVTAKSYGETWIYVVSSAKPDIKDSVKVIVSADATSKIECSPKTIRLFAGETSEVSATVINTYDTNYDWQISDLTVAKIEGNTITANKIGTTWLYAINSSIPSIKDSIKITVMPNQKSVSFTDENIAYEGRFNFTSSEAQYFYPGSTITTTFTGTSVYARFNKVEAYYWIEIDDIEPFKIGTKSNKNLVKNDIYRLAEDLAEGTHTLRITLCSEGIYKNPKFYGLVIDENASLAKPAAKPVKFEFIGNSITCGYGTEVTDRSAFKDSTSNFCHGFAYLTTKEFNAELMVVARSGIGIYRNYCNAEKADGYGSMPDNYEKLWLQSSTNWDFTKYTPDVLFINLGTNDTWEMKSFNAETYETCYRGLMDKIYSHYPNVKIVLLTGSMMDATALKAVKPILNKIQEDYSTDEHPIYRYDFAQTAGTGADWHPCAAQQATMGKNLIKFLKDNNIVE